MPRLSAIPRGCPFHPRCPQAIAICKTERPLFRDNVACHLAADGPGPSAG
jgi:peptide/nickel transport system ATP-binding protein